MKKDFYTWGSVHAASYFAEGEYRPNAATRDIMTDFNRRQRGSKVGTVMKFNPNKGIFYCEECTSLNDYASILYDCYALLGLLDGTSAH